MQSDGQSSMPGIPFARREVKPASDSSPQLSTPSAQPLQIPDHELLHLIGRGSYGEVWLARNAIGTLRAVKIVHRQSFQHAEHFEREFKGLLQFEPISRSHDGLVDILQIGRRDDAGYFFYVMELADDCVAAVARRLTSNSALCTPHSAPDQSLLTSAAMYAPKTLRSEIQARGSLPPADCIAIGHKLAAALEHLHAHGLVHRDIKPSNIIFVNGEPKLADIGLVAAIDEAHSLVGTVGYIPPEGPGTPQADLYSLGKVLYEIVFGKDRQEFPQLPADLHSHPDYAALLELNEVILKACETDPHRRYASATALGEDLARLQQGRSVKRHRTAERRWDFVKRYCLATAAVTLLVAGGWLLSRQFHDAKVQPAGNASSPATPATTTQFIAVLPFNNESPDSADEYLARSMADELGGVLTRIPELRVLGRDSAAALKNAKDRRAAAQELKVSAWLTGLVRKTGNQLQLTAQLVNAADDSLLWSEIYDRDLNEFFGIQTDIAEKVAGKLAIKITESVQASLARKPTQNLEAYRLCLEGRDWLNREAVGQALTAFQEASRLNPNFAQAYAGLSDVYGRAGASKAFGLSPQETRSNALALAEHAVRLDPRSVEAHISLARGSSRLFDWESAEKGFAVAITLNPTHASAHQNYGHLLAKLGRFEEAIVAGQRAKQLDPWSRRTRSTLAWVFLEARKYEQAKEEFEGLVKLDANYANGWDGLSWCYEAMGKYDEAVAAREKAQRLWRVPSDEIAELAQAYKSGGMRGYHQKELERLLKQANSGGYVDTFWIAVGYAETGQKDLAFQWLERAYEERFQWMGTLAVEYRLFSLHSEPRFAALLEKMGLKLPVW